MLPHSLIQMEGPYHGTFGQHCQLIHHVWRFHGKSEGILRRINKEPTKHYILEELSYAYIQRGTIKEAVPTSREYSTIPQKNNMKLVSKTRF